MVGASTAPSGWLSTSELLSLSDPLSSTSKFREHLSSKRTNLGLTSWTPPLWPDWCGPRDLGRSALPARSSPLTLFYNPQLRSILVQPTGPTGINQLSTYTFPGPIVGPGQFALHSTDTIKNPGNSFFLVIRKNGNDFWKMAMIDDIFLSYTIGMVWGPLISVKQGAIFFPFTFASWASTPRFKVEVTQTWSLPADKRWGDRSSSYIAGQYCSITRKKLKNKRFIFKYEEIQLLIFYQRWLPW